MRKVILALVVAAFMVPMAMADIVDFSIKNVSWSWAGGATPLTGSDGIGQVSADGEVGGNVGTAAVGGTTFSTGNFVSTNGTTWTFGPAAANSFTINGCGGPCFQGSIVSSSLVSIAGGSTFAFTANLVIGNMSSALFTLMGIPVPADLNNWVGSVNGTLHGTLTANGGGGTSFSSLDLIVAPVPEPGTLALFGSGLIGMAGYLRRKIGSLR